jgi:hypothetical protein
MRRSALRHFGCFPPNWQANLPSPELLAREVHKYEQLTQPKPD